MEERRRFMRFEIPLDIKYKIPGESIDGLSQGKDFSRNGIGLYLNKRIPRGTIVDLEINIPGEAAPVFATGRVAWAKEAVQRRDDFGAGLELININSFDKSRVLEYVYNQWYKTIEKTG